MAELKNLVLSVVVILAAAIVGTQLYVFGASNGGYVGSPSFPLNSSTVNNYISTTNNFTATFANATKATSEASPSDNPNNALGSLSTSGAQAVSFTFESLDMMYRILAAAQTSLTQIGVPLWVFSLGYIFVGILMIFAILAAVFKWWL